MSVNVLDGNGNLKKIAHGFPESKFNVLRADIIENIESTDTASKNYAVGDYLIMANGQLVKVINAISEDSVITSNDVQAITVEEMIANKVDISSLGTAAYKAAGSANGVAELDANGKIPSSQLPSFVDDVVEAYYKSDEDRFYEEETFETLITPVSGKSWVDIPSNKSYRWTGTVYTRVDEGVQLGETSDTAYRGDRGKTAYDHATESGIIGSAKTSGLYKIAITANGHISEATAVQSSDLDAGTINGINITLEA